MSHATPPREILLPEGDREREEMAGVCLFTVLSPPPPLPSLPFPLLLSFLPVTEEGATQRKGLGSESEFCGKCCQAFMSWDLAQRQETE